MKKNQLFIAIASGCAAALLHASIFAASPLSVALFYLAPLPLFITILGAGLTAGLTAAGTATLLILLILGPRPAMFFAAVAAAAPVLLGRLALLNRPENGVSNEGEAVAAGVAWYPEGRLVLWAAVMAGLLLCLTIILTGPDADSFRAVARQAASEVMAPALDAMSETQRDEFLNWVVAMAPLASAAAWLTAMAVNMRLAIAVLSRSGQSLRPWATFGRMVFPIKSLIALGLALGIGLAVPGTAGLMAEVFAAALLTAYTILGLAVVHGLLAGSPARGLVLTALYIALLLLNAVIAVPLALIGMADCGFGLRRRNPPNQPNQPNQPTNQRQTGE